MLAGQSKLVASTHFPAERRPYQLQNVEAALFAAEEAGCSLDVRGEDIVNGVRSTTLTLLWTLLSNFQVQDLWLSLIIYIALESTAWRL